MNVSFRSINLTCLTFLSLCSAENAVTTKVHITEINPNAFNWSISSRRDFYYRSSLVNLPDLPGWLTYKYSDRHRSGFLYGVPPSPTPTKIEIVALNRDTYETKRKILLINVTEKAEPAKYEVQMKIDNLNVEDLFDSHRVMDLRKVLTKILWPDSRKDLYMTFLASAVTLGARLPLRPHDGEGRKDEEEEPEDKLVQYETVQRATSTLRSMSNNRDTPQPNPKVVQKVEEDVSRPSPPPYGAARRIIHLDS